MRPMDLGPGRIVTAHFSRGEDMRTDNCDGCYCECHEETPLPPGVYVTVRLDNPKASVGLARVNVQLLDDGGDDK